MGIQMTAVTSLTTRIHCHFKQTLLCSMLRSGAQLTTHALAVAYPDCVYNGFRAEAAEGVSFAEPLRRYANCAAPDFKLSARGIIVNGELKTGAPVTKAPEVCICTSLSQQAPAESRTILEWRSCLDDN